jgi:hypothetical protein
VTVEAETKNSVAKEMFVSVNRIAEGIGSDDVRERHEDLNQPLPPVMVFTN